MAAIAADRDLLFGLLALQNGLIDQGQLVAAFQAWTRDKARPLADHLVARGDLDADAARRWSRRWSALHLEEARRRRREEPGRHPRRPLDPREPGRARRPRHRGHPRPRRLRLGSTRPTATPTAPPATPSARPPPTASGSASCGPTPGAAWAPSSWPSTPSCTARWRSSRSSTSTPTTRPAAPRFLLEAEITGGLEHPGIVPVYGLGTYGDGRPYYAMRFIRGDSLKEAIDRFHADEALKTDPGRRSLELRKLLRRFTGRLQRDRLRPQPRRAAPRHQAGQHHRRQARRDAGGRLGPGQAAGPGRAGPTRASGRWCPARPAAVPRRCRAAPWGRRPT